MRTKLSRVVMVCVAILAGRVCAEPIDLPRDQLPALQAATRLPPEQRLWLWWCELDILHGNNDPILNEIARIAGSFGVGDHWTDADYRHADAIAAIADVPLVLNTMPFNRQGSPMCTLPPTVEDTLAELQFIVTKFQRIKVHTSRIEAVTFDMECQVAPSAEIRKLVRDTTRLIYPDATLLWYRNGDWAHAEAFSAGLRTAALYRPYSPEHTEQWFARMIERWPGETYGVWISIGSCYHDDAWQWNCPMTLADWTWFGRLMVSNDLIAETIVYPMPGRAEATTSIAAFLAFVRGVTGE